MKNIKNSLAVLAIALALVSCSNDDAPGISGTGNLELEFDNAYGLDDLILNNPQSPTSQGETLKIDNIKCIVSNIVLTKEDGTTFTYPKNQSYFIVDESNPDSHVLELSNVPAGNYNKVTFGIGVDEAQFNLGEAAQGSFLAQAQAAGLMSDWPDGYQFLSFEGVFTSSTITAQTPFLIRTQKTASDYNYTEITLDMPENALVRTSITPEIHIIADASKIIDGTNKISLAENTVEGSATINSGTNLSLITANVAAMFSVNHVHND